MSDMQNFIGMPAQALSFKARVLESLRTVLRFILDQKWISLVFLLAYLALMHWDSRYATASVPSDGEGWLQQLPAFLDPLRQKYAQRNNETWRALLAGLLTLLYWGNALLFIADRSEAFRDASVVGLVRYLMRGLGIALLLAIPTAIGFGLLVLPGLLMLSIIIAATTIAVFDEKSVFRSIASGYRLASQSLPGQARVLGFSLSFVHLIGGYGLTLLVNFSFMLLTLLVAFGLEQLLPSLQVSIQYGQTVLSNLFSSFLNLAFSIFVLRLYAEHLNLMPAVVRSERA